MPSDESWTLLIHENSNESEFESDKPRFPGSLGYFTLYHFRLSSSLKSGQAAYVAVQTTLRTVFAEQFVLSTDMASIVAKECRDWFDYLLR